MCDLSHITLHRAQRVWGLPEGTSAWAWAHRGLWTRKWMWQRSAFYYDPTCSVILLSQPKCWADYSSNDWLCDVLIVWLTNEHTWWGAFREWAHASGLVFTVGGRSRTVSDHHAMLRVRAFSFVPISSPAGEGCSTPGWALSYLCLQTVSTSFAKLCNQFCLL